MEQKDNIIQLGSMNLAASSAIVNDGGMEEIMNLRHKNGSLRPIGTIPNALFESNLAGSFVVGVSYLILSIGTTDFTLIGAASNTIGLTFVATGVGSGTGTAGIPSQYMNGVSNPYIHSNNDYEHWLGVVNGNITWFASNINGVITMLAAPIVLLACTNPKISSIKNIVSVAWVDTEVHRMFLFWDTPDGSTSPSYQVLDPSFLNPAFNFYLYALIEDIAEYNGTEYPYQVAISSPVITTGVYTPAGTSQPLSYDDNNLVWEAIQGAINKGVYQLNQTGKISGFVLIRYAIQLFDGTYIKHSPVMLVNTQNNQMQNSLRTNGYFPYTAPGMIYTASNDGGNYFTIFSLTTGYDLMMVNQSTIPSNWEDLILSVDIFMSSPIQVEDYLNETGVIIQTPPTQTGYSPTFQNPIVYTDKQLHDKVINNASFFLIKSIPIKDLIGITPTIEPTPQKIDLTEILPILETQQVMVDDNSSYINLYGNAVYSYNQEEHLANIISDYFKGYPLMYYQLLVNSYFRTIPINAGSFLNGNTYTVTTTGTTDFTLIGGVNTVGTTFTAIGAGAGTGTATPVNQVTELASRSAIAALTIAVYIKNENIVQTIVQSLTPDYGSTIYDVLSIFFSGLFTYPDSRAFQATIILQIGPFYYSLTDGVHDYLPLEPHTYLNLACYVNPGLKPIQAIPISAPTIPTLSNLIEYRLNVLKVSSVDNPIVFPDSSTYQIGGGTLVGLRSNGNPISLGQFGQYPLIVYATDGRWALEQGSGDVVYASIRPLSRDVCVDPASITSIDQAIIFVSASGLMIDTGQNVQDIAAPLNGTPLAIVSGLDQLDILKQAMSNDQLVQLTNSISQLNFMDYLKGSLIAFIYREDRELIISNPLYAYSYIFNFDTKTYYKTDYQVKYFVNDYPNTYALLKDVTGITQNFYLYSLSGELRSGNRQTMLLTRPIKVYGEQFKESTRAVLRSMITPIGKSVGFYVFGSEDGLMWRFLGGSETNGVVGLIPVGVWINYVCEVLTYNWINYVCEVLTYNWINYVCEVLTYNWINYVCEQVYQASYILYMGQSNPTVTTNGTDALAAYSVSRGYYTTTVGGPAAIGDVLYNDAGFTNPVSNNFGITYFLAVTVNGIGTPFWIEIAPTGTIINKGSS
jgi:hypothetical protein